jgi:mannose-1-phosphate guanylyltransferase
MILSAGLGTRLRPLTDELPKPLVPVGDRPAIAHIQAKLALAGYTPQIVNTHYQMERFEEGVRDAVFLPETVFLQERTILGTAGGVANARDAGALGDSFGRGVLVWNGDILADAPIDELAAALSARPHLDAVWIVAPRARGEGTVGIDAEGLVCRVRTHRRGIDREVAGGDFLGISILSDRLVRALPTSGCLVGDVLGPRLDQFDGQRGAIGVVLHESPWDDLGSPAAYFEANRRWLRERGERCYLGLGAVAPVGTTGIVGAGATLTGRAPQDVVVWPGATGHDLPDRTILTRGGVVSPLVKVS